MAGGSNRTYRLRIPRSYDPRQPLPLVLAFHGFKNTAADEEGSTGLSMLAESERFIVAYPQGQGGPPGAPTWYSWNAGGCSAPEGTCCTASAPAPGMSLMSHMSCGQLAPTMSLT